MRKQELVIGFTIENRKLTYHCSEPPGKCETKHAYTAKLEVDIERNQITAVRQTPPQLVVATKQAQVAPATKSAKKANSGPPGKGTKKATKVK